MSSGVITTPGAPIAPVSPLGRQAWRWIRAILVANLVAQIAIIVTGGLVRLTGSGLGCPTWPRCVPGSFTPVVTQPEGYHKYIEFGNRTLTGVLGLVALATLVAVLVAVRACGARKGLIVGGAVPLLGVVIQAVLGGITVLTELSPATVAAHFLVSAALVAASTWLLLRITPTRLADQGAASRPRAVHREVRLLAVATAAVGTVVIVLGTVVTGSGPHSGDADTPARFGFDPAQVSWLHADAVMLFVGLVAALLVSLRVTGAPAAARRRTLELAGVTLAQGLIGYVQYFTGLPVVLVALHMLGAALLTVALTAAVYRIWSQREPSGEPAANLT